MLRQIRERKKKSRTGIKIRVDIMNIEELSLETGERYSGIVLTTLTDTYKR